MHEKSVRRPRSPADRAQPLRALAQPLVVQRRGVLHQQYRRFQGAALGHGLAVRLQDVVHRHARARQQPVRRVPVVALGKHRRQVRARTAVPRLAHDKQPLPHARVKVVRPRELAHAPVLAGPPPPRREAPRQQRRLAPQPVAGGGAQRPQPDRLGAARRNGPARRAAAGRSGQALPARSQVARAALRGVHAGLQQPGLDSGRLLPVPAQLPRGPGQHVARQMRHRDRGQDQEAIIADHVGNLRLAGPPAPPQVAVARRQAQRGRHERQPAQHALAARAHQVAHTPARCPADAQRMPGVQQRVPRGAVAPILHPHQPHPAQLGQRAGELRARGRPRHEALARRRAVRRRGQAQPAVPRQHRQRLARRRRAQLPLRFRQSSRSHSCRASADLVSSPAISASRSQPAVPELNCRSPTRMPPGIPKRLQPCQVPASDRPDSPRAVPSVPAKALGSYLE